MVNFSTPPGLEGLLDLDRKGVDIRPTLLRVLTDQYLLEPSHTPEEERHYTELAMRLIDETDIPTRAAIAAKLAPARHRAAIDHAAIGARHARHRRAGAALLALPDAGGLRGDHRGARTALCRDHRPARPAGEQAGAGAGAGGANAAAKSPPAVEAALAELKRARQTEPVDQTVPANQPSRWNSPKPERTPSELCELFFAAGSPERRLILHQSRIRHLGAEQPPAPMQRADVWQMELRRSSTTPRW